jgi:hypothetical protein
MAWAQVGSFIILATVLAEAPGQLVQIGAGLGAQDVGVEGIQQAGIEGDLDAFADPFDRRPPDILLRLRGVPIHLVTEDAAGDSADHRAGLPLIGTTAEARGAGREDECK